MRRPGASDEQWTAQAWADLPAAEQDALFQASVITDLSQVPAEYLASVRRIFDARIAQREMPNAS